MQKVEGETHSCDGEGYPAFDEGVDEEPRAGLEDRLGDDKASGEGNAQQPDPNSQHEGE